jgi:ArsR family transcriptional regulator
MKKENLIAAIEAAAEPIRLEILRIIAAHGELRAKDILPAFDITQPTLSHHMSVLEEVGLVSARREGRSVYYSINKKTFISMNEFFLALMEPAKTGEAVIEDVKKSQKEKKASAKVTPVADTKGKDKKKKDKEKDKEKDKKKSKEKDKKKKK